MANTPKRPTAEDAREALRAVDATRAGVAPFARSPWWLYPLQGLGVAGLIVGMPTTKVDIVWGSSVLVAAILLLCSIPWLQHGAGRVVMDAYNHPATRLLGWGYALAIIVLASLALVSANDRGLSWVVYSAAGAGFLLTVALGPFMDARLTKALRTSQ